MEQFAEASADDWILSDRLSAAERGALLAPIGFGGIVARLETSARLLHARSRESTTHPGYSRIELVIEAEPEAVLLFHSSRCGYRAQYYQDILVGERANTYAVTRLLPGIATIMRHRRLPRPLVEASLGGQSAKIWIHQGQWFRQRRRERRLLLANRWQAALTSDNPDARRKGLWGSLHPAFENRFDIKGAWVTTDGAELAHPKPTRGCDIQRFGFT